MVENRHLNVSALDLLLTKRFYVSGLSTASCCCGHVLNWSMNDKHNSYLLSNSGSGIDRTLATTLMV